MDPFLPTLVFVFLANRNPVTDGLVGNTKASGTLLSRDVLISKRLWIQEIVLFVVVLAVPQRGKNRLYTFKFKGDIL